MYFSDIDKAIYPSTDVVSCKTINGRITNASCIFPFTFLGNIYNKCTWDGDSSGGAWCSTTVDALGNHIKGQWGNCGAQCPVEGN